MQKIWGSVLNYVLNNKRNSIFIFVGVILFTLTLWTGTIGAKGDQNSQVKGINKISELQLQKTIKENKEKYHPKNDWLNAHPQTLPLSTKSAIILDYNTNQLLYSLNENEKLFPASITKILTATIVLENMDVKKDCEITENAANMEPNKITMRAGEKLKIEDLLYGLMMISANDAAEALADCYPEGREAFITKMNQKVKELGLTETHFVNPSGWHDDNHFTSAYDMATITNYALKSNPNFLSYFGREEDYSQIRKNPS